MDESSNQFLCSPYAGDTWFHIAPPSVAPLKQISAGKCSVWAIDTQSKLKTHCSNQYYEKKTIYLRKILFQWSMPCIPSMVHMSAKSMSNIIIVNYYYL